jgi:tetratricopeptide (TPR) repeat protein
MDRFFISHSSKDDAFTGELRRALADHGIDGWIDSRELLPGGLLDPDIKQAIEESVAYAVVVTPASLQSKWVAKELRYALELQKLRGRERFPVIPLLLDGTKLGVLEDFFDGEPIYSEVSSEAGGVEAALHAILVAVGKRLPIDVVPAPQPKAEPLEDLVLELSDLKFHEQDGIRRASARARLVYEPATQGQPEVTSVKSWRFIAPLGPIETEDLRWYLEKYAMWPSGVSVIQNRARKVDENLVKWGKLLHDEAMPVAHTSNVMRAWEKIDGHAGRRFSVHVDSGLEDGASESEVKRAREAATDLLALPWELLHNGESYLFQGAKPTRVRRRLPNTKPLDVPVVAPPIRILLVTARPEDDSCGYIDHRASALPLVEAMESLPGLVQIHLLTPPTLPALQAELDRAREERTPYHAVHFDGHGVYDRSVGLGGLCFELPEDAGKLEKRRHVTVFTDELGPLLSDHRIPLVFLDACQSALAEKSSESVASGLLKVGVASVVAMSHSVLVESARCFAEAFYKALAAGKRVGDAMLAGQRNLKDDSFRGRIFGAGELRLADWFVPVLYQEKSDPQLFIAIPAKQTQEDFKTALAFRFGDLPPTPETGFVGRSRELLALQRLLRPDGNSRYAVVRGQGGEGKTALAAEFARWMVRSHQLQRVAFVSVEIYSHVAAVLDAVGRQLVGAGYSVATFESVEKAVLPVERALREQSTLLVVDNMESILLPPFLAENASAVLTEDGRHELDEILKLCERLMKVGDTRLIFTSREALPAPFSAERNRRDLHRLDTGDGVKLIERTLNAVGGDTGSATDAMQEEIVALVEAVHCHARTLALLAPALRKSGVEATSKSLALLMAEMEKRFPGSRENSLFASVELSLRRMSTANRERARVLGVFHGVVDLDVLRRMMEWEEENVVSLASELVEIGLASLNNYNHLSLNPALSPYLSGRLEVAEREELTARWVEAMLQYAWCLDRQKSLQIVVAANLTLLELPNLIFLLEFVQTQGDAKATVELTTTLYTLLKDTDKKRLLEWVGKVRDAADATMGNLWNHERFDAKRNRIEQQIANGQLREALVETEELFNKALAAGKHAYPIADYDLAMAYLLMAKVFKSTDCPGRALPLLDQARCLFEIVVKERDHYAAKLSALQCLLEQGECFDRLTRFDEAKVVIKEAIDCGEKLGAERHIAIGKSTLGTICLHQKHYSEALDAYREACELFKQLREPENVAKFIHQTGKVYTEMRDPEAAEDAYRQSLEISVQLGKVTIQAGTLGALGNLYSDLLDRSEEAVAFYLQSAKKYLEIGDVAKEGHTRYNLVRALTRLRRFDEARQEILRAIECKSQFGHASQPWSAWAILASIERDSGNPAASAEAKCKAIESFLAYRREGGENHSGAGRVCHTVTQALLAVDAAAASTFLDEQVANWEAAGYTSFIPALQAIVAGSRDRTLADAPDLTYDMAAEILFLIETQEKHDQVT